MQMDIMKKIKSYKVAFFILIACILYLLVSNIIEHCMSIERGNIKEECHAEGKCVKFNRFSTECVDCNTVNQN
jgi:hypothetical protein